jgi:WD40 repeat protein
MEYPRQPELSQVVLQALLTAVDGQAAIDAVWDVHLTCVLGDDLRELILEHQWRPSDARHRAVMLIHLGDREGYGDLDLDGSLLSAAFEAAVDPRLQGRLLEFARDSGHVSWLNATLARRTNRLGALSQADWVKVIEDLEIAEQWERLWQLAREAPPLWGIRIFVLLDHVQWQPADAWQRSVYEELRELAMAATDHPVFPFGDPIRVEYEEPVGPLTHHVVSADGSVLAAAGADGTPYVWLLPSGALIRLADAPIRVLSLAITPDGSLLAAGAPGGEIRLWHLPEGRSAGSLRGHSADVSQLAVTADGSVLVSGCYDTAAHPGKTKVEDDTVRLWRLPDLEPAGVLPGHRHAGALTIVEGTPDMLVTSDAGTVRLWRLPEGSPEGTMPFSDDRSCRIARFLVSPGGGTLVGIGAKQGEEGDVPVAVWPLLEADTADRFQHRAKWADSARFAVSPDGLVLGIVENTRVWLHDLPTRSARSHRFRARDAHAVTLDFTPDGWFLVGGNPDRPETVIWPLPAARPVTLRMSGARLVATAEGALLVGGDEDDEDPEDFGGIHVSSYRPSKVDELVRKPVTDLTGADMDALSKPRNIPAEQALAAFTLALARLQHLRDVELADDLPKPGDIQIDDAPAEPST